MIAPEYGVMTWYARRAALSAVRWLAWMVIAGLAVGILEAAAHLGFWIGARL